MKELTQTEVQTVSGAGAIASSLSVIGATAGTALQFFGMKHAAANAKDIGNNVGLMIESVYGIFSSTMKLIFGKE